VKRALKTAILLSCFAAGAAAAQPRVEASLEQSRAAVGEPIYLYISFKGAQDVDRPEIRSVDGLKIKYVGPTSEVSVVNGVVSRSVTYSYLILPLKAGKYELGPYSVGHQGRTYSTNPLILVVSGSAPAPGGSAPAYSPRGAAEPEPEPYQSDKVFLAMDIGSREMYINEVVPVTIKVYVHDMGLRDIEFPSFSHEGFSVGEFQNPERRSEVLRGVRYEVLVFHQDLFGIKEGDYVLGPARLNCKMVVRRQPAGRFRSSLFGITFGDDDFMNSRFGVKTYPIELESNEIPVTILPFPEKGRPEDFQGAVGDFAMDVTTSPRKVKVGDPVTMTVKIRGRGNLDTVTAPRLVPVDTDKIKTYEPQASKKDGRKIYEQIIIPKTDELKEIPAVSFSFFNPRTRRYETLTKGPFPVEVTAQPEAEKAVKMVAVPGAAQIFYPQEKLGEDIIHIKEDIGDLGPRGRFLFASPLFWVLQILPAGLFLVFQASYRKRERILTDKKYARFLRAPRKARTGLARAGSYLKKKEILPFYDTVFKTLQEYLAHRFSLPIGSVTGLIIDEKLRPAGCDEEMLEMLKDILSKCEMARYASFVPGGEEEILENVRRVIDHLEKFKI